MPCITAITPQQSISSVPANSRDGTLQNAITTYLRRWFYCLTTQLIRYCRSGSTDSGNISRCGPDILKSHPIKKRPFRVAMTETVVFMQFNLFLCNLICFYAVLFDFTLFYSLLRCFIRFYVVLFAFYRRRLFTIIVFRTK